MNPARKSEKVRSPVSLESYTRLPHGSDLGEPLLDGLFDKPNRFRGAHRFDGRHGDVATMRNLRALRAFRPRLTIGFVLYYRNISTPHPAKETRHFGPKCNTPTLLHLGPNAKKIPCCICSRMQHLPGVAKAVGHPTDATSPHSCCISRQMQHPLVRTIRRFCLPLSFLHVFFNILR